MKSATKLLIWVPVILVLVVAGLNVFLLTLDLNAYRGRLESLLSDTLGRQIGLRGKMGFKASLAPTVSLRDVVIRNPAWASRPDFATAEEITLQVALIPLLEKRIEIARIGINQADILFESGPDGSNNWKFGRKASTRQGIFTFTGLSELELGSVTLGYRTANGDERHVRIDTSSATWPPDTPLHLSADGNFEDRQFSLSASAGTVSDLLAGESGEFPLDTTVLVNDVRLTAKGDLAVPVSGEFKASVSLSGEDLSALGRLIDRELPSRGPFRVSVETDLSGGSLRISEMQADIPGWGDVQPLRIEEGQAEFGAEAPTKIRIGGLYGEDRFSLDLQGAEIGLLRNGSGEWPVSIDASFARSALRARGAVTLPMREPRGRFDVDLHVPAGSGLPNAVTSRLEGYLPASLKGTLDASRDSVSLHGIELKAGATAASGTVSWGRGQGTPRLDTNLKANVVDLSPFLASGHERNPDRAGDGALDTPLNTAWLRGWNSKISISLSRLEGLAVPLHDLVLRGELHGNRLDVAALQGTIPGGRISLTGSVDAGTDTPTVSTTARSAKFDLGALLTSLDHGRFVTGDLRDTTISLNGSGSSLRALLTNSGIDALTTASWLSIGEGPSPRAIELKANRFRAASRPATPVSVRLDGTLNGVDVSSKGSIGTMSNWLHPGTARKLALVTRSKGTKLDLSGDLVLPWTGRIDLRYKLTGRQLSRLGPLVRRPLPDLRNFSFRGTLFLDDDTLDLTDLAAAADGLEAEANVTVSAMRTRPAVSGSVTVANLDLASPPGRSTRPASPESEGTLRIPDVDLPIEALRAINLDLQIDLTDLKWREDSIGFFRLKTRLNDGHLLIDPIGGDLTGGGNLKGRLEYLANLRTPTASIDFSTNDFNYGRWLNDGDMSASARGLVDIHLDLKGRGSTTRQLLATASGVETVVAGPVKFLHGDRLRLTVNVENLVNLMFPQYLKRLEGNRQKSGIVCFASRWDVSNGMARSDDIVLVGLNTVIAASGAINLASEQIDILVYPRDKGIGLIDVAFPVKVTGTITKPHYEIAEIPKVSALGFLDLSLANPTHLVETLEGLPAKFADIDKKLDGVSTNRCTEAIETSDDKAAKGKDSRARGGVGSRIRGLFQRIEGNPTDPQPENIDP